MSTIKITKKELGILADIHSTGGAEIADYGGEYQSLVDKELIIVGSARGPGKRWRRVVLTDRGIAATVSMCIEIVLEG